MDQFFLATLPWNSVGISYGCPVIQEFFLATKNIFYKCIPLLGVQRHIELPWQTLPESYQGIGLPNLALHSLASKLQLISCIWGFKDATSLSLLRYVRHGYRYVW
jgi:hypothetical protein